VKKVKREGKEQGQAIKKTGKKLANDARAEAKATSEKSASEKEMEEKIAIQNAVACKAAAEKAAEDKASVEKAAQEKVAAEKVVAESIAADKTATEKSHGGDHQDTGQEAADSDCQEEGGPTEKQKQLEDAKKQLEEMGFSNAEVLSVLLKSHCGNVQTVIEELMQQ